MTKLADDLAKRIKNEFGYDVIPKIHRVRSGHWQKSAGAWSWFMLMENGLDFGSCETATEVAKAKKLSISGNEITVEEY